MRFRTKTMLGVALIELALLAVLVGSALSILRSSSETELTRRVQLGGKLLAAAARDAVISQDLATLDSLAAATMESRQIDFVRIVDANGRVLAERGDATLLAQPFHPDMTLDQVTGDVLHWSDPVFAGGVQHGEVRLGVSIEPLQVLLASARRWAAGIVGLELLLVAFLSALLGTYLVRQLDALRHGSERFAAGDFDYRVPVHGSDELAETARAFNTMAQELGASHDALQVENRKRLQAQLSAEQAQASIEDRTGQLNAIFALSPDGFVSFDHERRVKFASPAFMRMTGLEEAEIIGMDEAAFSARLERECIESARFPGVAALRATLKVGAGETAAAGRRQLIELATGSKPVLEVSLRLSDAETVSQILYFRDVTHETEVDRMKSEFLSTAAHELRTPMASIYGFSELMLAQEFSTEERREFIGAIHRQSELMVAIINELLDLARIEARRGKDFNFGRVDLAALLREFIANFKAPQGRPAPGLPVELAPCWVRADRKKLLQAVGNVVSNAYKYSPPEATVGIELLDIAAAGDGPGRVGIRITDRGIGMTPEQLSRVFERFYRADTSGKVPGTGLGMSIVKEIVDLHGGEVQIDSKAGAGTTVTLWLAAAAQV